MTATKQGGNRADFKLLWRLSKQSRENSGIKSLSANVDLVKLNHIDR